jgi:putative PEP-CTERM system TPR-repeat lipoprotein
MRALQRLGVLAMVVGVACSADTDVEKRAAFDRANAYAGQQQYAEAIIEYRRAIQIDPGFGQARQKLAEAYMSVNDVPGALREIVRAADLLPDDLDVQLKAGNLLLAAGRFEDARSRAEHVLARDRSNASGHVLRGNALAGLKDLDGALNELEEAIATDPTLAATYTSVANVQAVQGRQQEAEDAFRKAIAVAPDSPAIRLSYVNYLLVTKRFGDAERELKEAEAATPRDPLVNRALADFYVITGRPAESERYLRRLADHSRDSEARFALARLYLGTGRRDDALQVLTGLAADRSTFAEATLLLARLEYSNGQRARGYQLVDEVLVSSRGNPAALRVRAGFQLAEGKPQEALASLNSAIAGDPNSAQSFLLLGEVHAALRDLEEAKKAFNEVLRLQPNAVAAQLALSRLNLKTGQPDVAQQLADRAAKSTPNATETRSAVIRAALARQDFPRAASELRLLMAEHPGNADAHVLEGSLQMLQKNMPSAERAFLKATELEPLSRGAATGLIQLYFATGRGPEARTRIEKLLASAPDNADLLLLSARTYAALNDLAKSEQALRKVLEVDPTRMESYNMLSQLYFAQGRLNEAVKQLQTQTSRQPRAVGAHTMLGTLFGQLQRRGEAKEMYRKALAIDSNAAAAANNLAWMMAEDNENLDEALALATTAKTRHPESPEAADTLGWIYYKKGLTAQAISTLKESVEKQPQTADFQYHLGLAYAKNGDYRLARQALETALRLEPKSAQATEAKATLAQIATFGS